MLLLQEMVRGFGMGILFSDISENVLVCLQNLKKRFIYFKIVISFFFSYCVIICKMRVKLRIYSIIIDLNEFYFIMFIIIFYVISK